MAERTVPETGTNGAYVRFAVRNMTAQNKTALRDMLANWVANGSGTDNSGSNQPYGKTMFEAFKYFGGGGTSRAPQGPTGFGPVAFAGGTAFGALAGTQLSIAATVLGCATSFFYARLVGRDWARRRLSGRLARVDRFLAENPFTATLTLRLLPVGNNLALNLLAGLDRPTVHAAEVFLERSDRYTFVRVREAVLVTNRAGVPIERVALRVVADGRGDPEPDQAVVIGAWVDGHPVSADLTGPVLTVPLARPLPPGHTARVLLHVAERVQDSDARQRVETDTSSADGRYVLCGVPNDITLTLTATHGERMTGDLTLALDRIDLGRRDLMVSQSDTAARIPPPVASGDTVPWQRPAGSARWPSYRR